MSLHAELHRHLGGAIVPRIFWRFLHRTGHPLAEVYPQYEAFEAFITRPRASLTEFLELHTLVEQVQRLETLPYFVSKLVRGAYIFEGILYLELRHTPYYRTDTHLSPADRMRQMREVVRVIGEAGYQPDYPLRMRQILCMHSRLPVEINRAIIELAASEPDLVCGVDLAGPDTLYASRLEDLEDLFRYARSFGLKTTCHLFETANGFYPQLLPYLDRVGHGLQIPLERPDLLPLVAARGQCLEICPTSYLKTGTLSDLSVLRTVFTRCEEAGVDVAICTDNPGLHNVRLPFEYENLLTLDVIDFGQLRRCQEAAFRHAFAWPHGESPNALLHSLAAPGSEPMTPPAAPTGR
ncbi:MAG TPA: adenosine deaminase [Chthonomonadaceae bacterium]|nr:adenosine deaminase [Chthonomonadaceae bacterium]